jgi:hypothetical protein
MTHEEIQKTLAGLMRGVYESRLKQLQEIKAPLAGVTLATDAYYEDEWIAAIEIDEMFRYFEGGNSDEVDETIERALEKSLLFRNDLVNVGYLSVEKIINMKLKF